MILISNDFWHKRKKYNFDPTMYCWILLQISADKRLTACKIKVIYINMHVYIYQYIFVNIYMHVCVFKYTPTQYIYIYIIM